MDGCVSVLQSSGVRDSSFKGLVPDCKWCALRSLAGFFLRAGAVLLLLMLAGCAPAISSQLRKEASVNISFREVRRDLDLYMGRTFIWSGTILDTQNMPDGTIFKVLQEPSDYWGHPKDVDESGGRFMALDKRYLDPAIYAQGRAVTVAGELIGRRVERLGEMDYVYPLLAVKEIHLWPKETPPVPYYYYPYGPYLWGWGFYW